MYTNTRNKMESTRPRLRQVKWQRERFDECVSKLKTLPEDLRLHHQEGGPVHTHFWTYRSQRPQGSRQ